jgi:hypothetical protein
MSETKSPVQQIVAAYRDKLGDGKEALQYREFAAKLSEGFSTLVPFQSIEAWENGRWNPSMAFLDSLANMMTDWRHDFASDLLAALYPLRFKPTGKIGKHILEPSARP